MRSHAEIDRTCPLKIVIFTRSELDPLTVSFFNRLIKEPDIDVVAIIADEYPLTSTPFIKKLQKFGWPYFLYKIRKKVFNFVSRLLVKAWHIHHPLAQNEFTIEALAKKGVCIYHTTDVHCEENLAFISASKPELGVIYGSRILQDKVLSIPTLGTINIHKSKVPDYRGGGKTGYWELLAKEKEIGVTIHYAVAKVDEGDVLDSTIVPVEPYDTLKSLDIKASIVGNDLYYQVIKQIAQGDINAVPQNTAEGKTYKRAGEYLEKLLEKELVSKQEEAYRCVGRTSSWREEILSWIKYFILYPFLNKKRNELIKKGQAPIIFYYYHRIANDASTLWTLPLEHFVEQIELIRKYFPIVSLQEAVDLLDSGSNDQIAVAITFDDGYASNLSYCIPYLQMMDIPSTIFVSIGNTAEGQPFNHDTECNVFHANPMTVDQLRSIKEQDVCIGSHCYFHEDCGKIEEDKLEFAICSSKEKLEDILNQNISVFAFPKGIKKINITEKSWNLAEKTYDTVCSAYGGYNFPKDGSKHIKRFWNPGSLISIWRSLDGFYNFSDFLRRDLWTWRSSDQKPY